MGVKSIVVSESYPSAVESERLEQRISEDKHTLLAIWQALRLRISDTGLEEVMTTVPLPDQADYALRTDPFDQSETLTGVWRDCKGTRLGELQVRNDGSIYAEFDVVRQHPTDVRWFVESVTAWGTASAIKTELRLLPAV